MRSVKEIEVPPSAHKSELEGAYEVKLRTVSSEVLRELKEKYGSADVEIYTLAPDAEWSAVNAFYDGRLGPLNYSRDRSLAEERQGYRLGVWTRRGWFSQEAVAVAFINTGQTPEAAEQKFLAVFLAGK